MPPLVRIAFRNVLRNHRRSLITFSAVFLALTVMVCIRGLVNGMSDSIREANILGQTGSLQIHKRGFQKSMNGRRRLRSEWCGASRQENRLRATGVCPRVAAYAQYQNISDTPRHR